MSPQTYIPTTSSTFFFNSTDETEVMDEPDNFVYLIRLRIKKQQVYYLKEHDPIKRMTMWTRRQGLADEFSSKKVAQDFIEKHLKRYAEYADVIPELML